MYPFCVMLYSTIQQTRREGCTVSEPDQDVKEWHPPYMATRRRNFFDKRLGDNPVPPRIDRHFLDNYAGSVRPLLVATLKTMGMLDENNSRTRIRCARLNAPGENRKAVFRAWAQDFYAEQIDLGQQHATAQMLWESFSKGGGSPAARYGGQ